MMYDVIIIGAGAAGLMSAISASRFGKKVLVLEKNAKPGLKILISGGGRCNFTNLNITPNEYVSQNPHFCKSALNQFTQNDFIKFVEEAGVDYYEKTLGQLFCRHSSKEILKLLLKKCSLNHVEIKTGAEIQTLTKTDDIFTITTKEKSLRAKNMIVASGGLSFPKLGASDLGYQIARKFGHAVTELSPALDGFVFSKKESDLFQDLAGVSLKVNLKVKKRIFHENILFTHVGMSGPAALKGSLFWQKGERVVVDFLPQITDLSDWIFHKRKAESRKSILSLLSQEVVISFSGVVVKVCQLEKKNLADLSKTDVQKLKQFLKEFAFIPSSTVGYEKAEVTRGGVDTKDVSSKTMESKLVEGLFFVGEVLDVTGLLGGYNFQWAWSSGWVAGQSLH